ncbi:MAG: PilZ domain-containing protein [Methylococcaceae bacterium]|nr:PilZ domain-containing protein [Methylococcaceae bacterium]
MSTERREHRRLKAPGIRAGVKFNDLFGRETAIDADIVDISFSGIRVKLKQPLSLAVGDKIKITMRLPNSGTPFSVHGILKHQGTDAEVGVAYHHHDHVKGSIDDLIFECVQFCDDTVLIRTA